MIFHGPPCNRLLCVAYRLSPPGKSIGSHHLERFLCLDSLAFHVLSVIFKMVMLSRYSKNVSLHTFWARSVRQKQLFCFQVIKASHSSSQAREHIAQTFSSVGVYLDFFFLKQIEVDHFAICAESESGQHWWIKSCYCCFSKPHYLGVLALSSQRSRLNPWI